jgi:FlaA1/EpsC-like NDP-sugar epimerase
MTENTKNNGFEMDGLLAVAGVGSATSGNGAEPARETGGASRNRRRGRLRPVLRRVVLAVLAGGVLLVCRWLAYQLRFDFSVPEEYQPQLSAHQYWVVLLCLGWLFLFRQFSGIYKYFSLPDVRYLAYAMAFSAFSLYALRYLDLGYSPPCGVILLQAILSFTALGAMRSSWRQLYERFYSHRDRPRLPHRNVAIFGAGDAGASLVHELEARPDLGLVPVAFFDDDSSKWGASIHGVPVLHAPEQLLNHQAKLRIDEVVLAMPSAAVKRLQELVSFLHASGMKYLTVPSLEQLASGQVTISQLRRVQIEDLLGREPIDLKPAQIADVLTHSRVLVTGAGGSIGSELCRQIATYHPSRLLLVDQSEVQLFQIEQELIRLGFGNLIVALVADILDQPRIVDILRRHRPAVLFHAAAHKHVGMMESQPSEAIKNNTLGTAVLAESAWEYGVEHFVMISTDKAVNPTSVMGASKRLAEVFLQSFACAHEGPTRFVAVRFGNVLGSSGSVVPIFERQIAAGGPVTVTDPEVVRYFMTIPEAVGLVLQSCAQGQGGEIFILDMGKPVKIVDLAKQMIRLSGLEPGRDIQIRFTGLKPGEKLFEELHHLQANCSATTHPRIKRLASQPRALGEVQAYLRWLTQQLQSAAPDELKGMLTQMLPEYTPSRLSSARVADPLISTRNFVGTQQCPRFTNHAQALERGEHCVLCSCLKLCAWQYGWSGCDEPASVVDVEQVERVSPLTAPR